MNETQLKCFFYACECLNFTEAASKVFITQSALSRNIAKLEDELELQLFIRDTGNKRVRLTPGGTVFYNGLRTMKEQFKELRCAAKKAESGHSGKLSLGIFEAEYVDESLQKAIQEFSLQYPEVELNLQKTGYKGLASGLQEGTFDIIFTLFVEIENRNGIVYDDLYYLPARLALLKTHPLADQGNLTLIDFKDETFIIFPNEVAGRLNRLFMKTCQDAGFTPKTVMAPDLKTQLLWIEIGRGIAVTSARSYIANSPEIEMIKLAGMDAMMYVRAWNKENYNPTIAIFNNVMDRHRKLLKWAS